MTTRSAANRLLVLALLLVALFTATLTYQAFSNLARWLDAYRALPPAASAADSAYARAIAQACGQLQHGCLLH